MKSMHSHFNPSRGGTARAVIICLTTGSTFARDLDRAATYQVQTVWMVVQ
jgi:hypothetical protein